MVNSLKKGKKFEREVAKILSHNTGVEWKRVPLSGGFSTREGVKDYKFKGDVFTEDERFAHVVVECKATKSPIDINEFFFAKRSRILKWLWQTIEEAGPYYWILFFKWNRSKIFALSRYVTLMEELGVQEIKPILFGNMKFYLGILEKRGDTNG